MSTVKIADVDDYISPSQACINPLFTSKKKPNEEIKNNNSKNNSTGLIDTNASRIRRRRKRTPIVISQPQSNPVSEDTNTDEALASILIQKQDDAVKYVSRRSLPKLSYDIEDEDFSKVNSKNENKSTLPLSSSSSSTTPSTNITNNTTKETVSVADCLACSGCITSAEAVLVTTHHSIKTLMKQCSTNKNETSVSNVADSSKVDKKTVVFTISPASIADLIRVLHVSSNNNDYEKVSTQGQIKIMYQKIATFLKQEFNAKTVLDGSIPQKISLIESAIEFCHRYRHLSQTKNNHKLETKSSESKTKIHCKNEVIIKSNLIDIATPSIALSATETRYLIRSKENSSNERNQVEGIEIKHGAGIDHRLSYLYSDPSTAIEQSNNIAPNHVLPMLSSSCPGFVCFVEKTTPDIIANLCTVKSSMAIAGSIFKHNLLENKDLSVPANHNSTKASYTTNKHNRIYHVAVMPCHDKKLEAERKDLAWERFVGQEEKNVADVDLVITTNELLTVMADVAMNNTCQEENDVEKTETNKLKVLQEYFHNLPLTPEKTWTRNNIPDGACLSAEEGISEQFSMSEISDADTEMTMKGSGSYADFIFRFASDVLFGHEIPSNESLPWKNVSRRGIGSATSSRQKRSKSGNQKKTIEHIYDHCEVALYKHSNGSYSCQPEEGEFDSEIVLKFATAYGFKNIQLLMQQIRNYEVNQAGTLDYIEVMACPSGCLNGGGQIRTGSGMLSQTHTREKPSDKHSRVQTTKQYVMDLIPSLKIESSFKSNIAMSKQLLHTRYHVVPKLELATGATAGVAIDDIRF